MQMARFYDRNLWAMIRYHGAKKTVDGEILEDTIALELAEKMKGRESVALGTVFDTSPGALADTHGVKRVFHLALVQGVPGEGYRAAVEMVDTCVERCLRRMDAEQGRSGGWRSIAFPMMGTGGGGQDVNAAAKVLVGSIARYVQRETTSTIERVILMAWNRNDLHACTRALDEIATVEKTGDAA